LKLFFVPVPFETLSTLKRTVLLRGLHSPTVTTSPISTSLKQEVHVQLSQQCRCNFPLQTLYCVRNLFVFSHNFRRPSCITSHTAIYSQKTWKIPNLHYCATKAQ